MNVSRHRRSRRPSQEGLLDPVDMLDEADADQREGETPKENTFPSPQPPGRDREERDSPQKSPSIVYSPPVKISDHFRSPLKRPPPSSPSLRERFASPLRSHLQRSSLLSSPQAESPFKRSKGPDDTPERLATDQRTPSPAKHPSVSLPLSSRSPVSPLLSSPARFASPSRFPVPLPIPRSARSRLNLSRRFEEDAEREEVSYVTIPPSAVSKDRGEETERQEEVRERQKRDRAEHFLEVSSRSSFGGRLLHREEDQHN